MCCVTNTPYTYAQGISAKRRKELGVPIVEGEACKYKLYLPLHQLWTKYVDHLLKGASGPVEINSLAFTENLLEDTDGLRRLPPEVWGVQSNPSVISRCGSLRPSMYADVRYIDDVIAF